MQQIPRQHATTTNLHILALNLIDGRYFIAALQLPRHKVRMNHMVITTGPLKLYGGNLTIPSATVPCAIPFGG
jgi:hypothetical protein